VDSAAALTLSKNIWELQQFIRSGQPTARARQMLLRAYAQQVDLFEEGLGLPEEERAFILDREDSRDGVLLVHGSSGSPQELRALGEAIHKAGFSVFGLRLPAGPNPKEPSMLHGWESALIEVENRFAQLGDCCKNVAVVGFGLGATLAMQLDLDRKPSALVLLSPGLFPRLNFYQRMMMSLGLDRFDWVRQRMGWQAATLDAMAGARKRKWWYGVPVWAAMCKDDDTVDVHGLGFLRSRLTHHRSSIREFATGGHRFHEGERAADVQREVIEFLKANHSGR